jgi:hypothetical protein
LTVKEIDCGNQTKRTRRVLHAAAVGLIVDVACSPASADKTIYYTDSCVERESGDIGGYVVIVSDANPLPVIKLSWSEGALKQPVAAKVTSYDRRAGQLSFSVSIEWDEGKTRDIRLRRQSDD